MTYKLFLRCAPSLVAVMLSLATSPVQAQTLWHAGNFRYLPTVTGDLVTYVDDNLSHPEDNSFGQLTSNRESNFNAFLNSMFSAISASLNDGDTGDWCAVQARAGDAGYALRRFYDTGTGRWFVYGYDTTQYDHSYFFINPMAKRNIVIEVPHAPSDLYTDVQGALMFRELAARALLINKAHRCSSLETADCSLGETNACGGTYRESDMAHNVRNTFHLLHKRFDDQDSATKFVQLHGYGSSSSPYLAIIADGTTNDVSSGSVSVEFAANLRSYGRDSAVFSCQQSDDGNPPLGLCATRNVQGRYTNGSSDACSSSTGSRSNRFLHIEQAPGMRDTDDSNDTYNRENVISALRDTWPECNMNGASGTTCSLGSTQTQYSRLYCP